MRAMAGATRTHITINGNVFLSLGNQLRGKSCQPFAQDMRVQVNETGLYTYPDVVVACDPVQFAEPEERTLTNPIVIVEVLSPTTEAYDRGAKWSHYQRLSSLHDYVLVAQDTMRLEHYERQADGSWLLHTAATLGVAIALKSIGCHLNATEVYERVTFPAVTYAPRSTDINQ
jgi:Uma2 family endonuclease